MQKIKEMLTTVNLVLLTVVLISAAIAVPVHIVLSLRQHDAKMCDSMVACQVAYKSLPAYQSCAAQYRKLMIVPTKVDATILEKDFDAQTRRK